MTIQQANQYFAALPDGFADPEQLGDRKSTRLNSSH